MRKKGCSSHLRLEIKIKYSRQRTKKTCTAPELRGTNKKGACKIKNRIFPTKGLGTDESSYDQEKKNTHTHTNLITSTPEKSYPEFFKHTKRSAQMTQATIEAALFVQNISGWRRLLNPITAPKSLPILPSSIFSPKGFPVVKALTPLEPQNPPILISSKLSPKTGFQLQRRY